jgi:hypothetical protein
MSAVNKSIMYVNATVGLIWQLEGKERYNCSQLIKEKDY